MSNQPNQSWEEDELDVGKIIHLALDNWILFVISIPLCIGLSYLYTWYAHPVYKMTATVLVADESSDISQSILDEVGVVSKSRNIENEIAILSSRSLISEAVSELDLNVNYAVYNGVRSRDVYKNSPIELSYSLVESTPETFFMEVNVNAGWTGADVKSFWQSNGIEFEREQQITIGDSFENDLGTFNLEVQSKDSPAVADSEDNRRFLIRYDNTDKLTTKYQGLLKVKTAREKASILELNLEDKVKERGVDVLNTLLSVFIRKNIDQKNQLASNSLKFIDSQLDVITEDLASLEGEIKGFKTSSGISDVSAEALFFLEQVGSLDQSISEINVKLSIIEYLEKYIAEDKDLKNASPSSLGIEDPLLQQLIVKLSELSSERESMLKFTKPDNPLVEALDTKIEETKASLTKNLASIRSGLIASRNEIEAQLKKVEQKVNLLPKAEYELLALQRQYSIKESLYLLLLEKKSENSIILASTVSDNKVVDAARGSEEPIRPKKQIIYLLGLVVGLGIPSVFVLLITLFDSRIKGVDDLKNETDIPLAGIIPHHTEPDYLVVRETSNSAIAEAFRTVRTNLNFMTKNEELTHGVSDKVIQFTSAMGSEGKSFSSINLSASLAISGKKTIVVGLDLRKPKLAEYFNCSNAVGASSVLAGLNSLEESIMQTGLDNLDVLVGGPIPPNPSELLMSKAMKQMVDELSETYDYVILDTPPIGLVTDSLIISEHSAVTIYVVRQNVSSASSIKFINELYHTGKIPNIGILFNDVKMSKFGYGYGYGYGYGGYYAEPTQPVGLFGKLKKAFGKYV